MNYADDCGGCDSLSDRLIRAEQENREHAQTVTALLRQQEKIEQELAEARRECIEQARLNGMGGERELRLMARLKEAQKVAKILVTLDSPPEVLRSARDAAHSYDLVGPLWGD